MANRISQYNRVTPRGIQTVDWDSSEDVIGFVEQRWEARYNYRRAIENQWYMNIAQYLGLQYYIVDEATSTLRIDRCPPWRVRLVCNRLMPIVRKIVSKILRQRPSWVVLPATGDVEDQIRAIVGTKVLNYYWRVLDMDKVMVDALTWMGCCGNVFLRAIWDPSKGSELYIEPDEMAMLPKNLQRVAKGGVNLGDVQVELVTPFEIDPNPGCTNFAEASDVIHSRAKDAELVYDTWGVRVNPDYSDDGVLGRYYERRLEQLVGPSMFGGTRSDEQSNQVIVHEAWVAPTKKYPKGRYAAVAGGKILDKRPELPNRYYRIPYIHLQEIPVPGRLWGTCSLEQAIPLQAEYNRGRSSWIESRNLMSRPKWLVPKGSKISQTSLTSEPGEIIFHTPGFKPEAWSPPPIPDYVRQLLEYALRDLEDVSGIHEVSNARAPSGVRSGVAIATLQEQDDQMLAPAMLMIEKALSKLGCWVLQLVAENVAEERLIKIAGEDNEIDSLVFKGEDIMGTRNEPGINYFDVETQMGSQLPMSKASRLQFVIDLVREGILDRVEDKRKILKMLEMGDEEPFLNDVQLDRQQARRENGQIMQGVQFEPNPWDDHLIHIEEHRRYQKTPDYMKQAGPGTNENFEAHIQGHMLQAQPPAPPPQMMGPPQMQGPPPTMMPAGYPPAAVPQPPAQPPPEEAAPPELPPELLQLLMDHPELLNELQGAAA